MKPGPTGAGPDSFDFGGVHVSRILITGGAGFLGRRLARRLMSAGGSAPSLTLWDHLPFEGPHGAKVVVVDLLDDANRSAALTGGVDAIVHLAAVVSAQAEADFDLGMRVNLDGTRALLEACRNLDKPPVFVMTSSVAVFGGDLPAKVPDNWAVRPASSYGTEKAIVELLVNEYSRRGVIDGRLLRLPTVVVRPGRPNQAASSFASSIIREPLAGEGAVCPVDPATPMWLMSPDRAIDALVHALALEAGELGLDRVISLPGLSVTVAEMVAALQRVAGKSVAELIDWTPDPAIAAIVQSWPGDFEATRAWALGFLADGAMDEIIEQHIRDRKEDQ